ncbi:hypothetical protein [Neobacillus thermocopriae]|uniref:Circular bacteriocin, circularin A/uberolysin family n=1 Tax=Neobacillus thermocopriae TaxID=1215031 RepID=A0A6B3TQU5_9BACI|nr:hypothetical protein [Neobacillus thermocopriae]MED3623047.1 hypothetical protein [Neobacillus thermocopriae]MED3714942.1 hypothetical protein [Neobacillus thermocopriae]NEX78796.1 hypothetical protein [Neobacillus thermocopriae]
MRNLALKQDAKLFVSMTLTFALISMMLFAFNFAAVNLGLSASTATLLYTALNAVAWGATAASIVASFGLGAFVAQAVWSYVKKHTLKQFLQY